jgi:hypothetical protein
VNSEATLIAESKINQILRELTEQTGAVKLQLSDHTKLGAVDFDIRIELIMPTEKPKSRRVSALFHCRWSQR